MMRLTRFVCGCGLATIYTHCTTGLHALRAPTLQVVEWQVAFRATAVQKLPRTADFLANAPPAAEVQWAIDGRTVREED